MLINELFMQRCLELAKGGEGNVSPNPLVGSVIVYDDKIIGEGFHRRYGEAHAEVMAVESVKDKSLLKHSTLYVSLEPCSHYGKTSPCAGMIIRSGIPRVVAACLDPFPEVSGRGIKMLTDAGVEVVTGVLEKEALELNRYFMTAQTRKRPYIILKWAQSNDGFIDNFRENAEEKPYIFSTSLTRMYVHKLRSEVQAIMVGTNTAFLDNPSLTVRYWAGKSPLRVFPDNNMRIPRRYKLYDGTVPTLVFTSCRNKNSNEITDSEGVEINNNLILKEIEYGVNYLKEIMNCLYEKKIYSLLVEGGASLHESFIKEGLYDEIIIENLPVGLYHGVKAVELNSCNDIKKINTITIPYEKSQKISSAQVSVYRRF
jgi:diaminohydroxyphosphoribosylaminopyrimidine deaminase/5-amino-6-(5-phosphoribosylamino)uracil reductase